MKKYFLVVAITLCAIITTNSAFSQFGPPPGCPQKALVKRYLELQDSIARFFSYVKKTTDPSDYTSFGSAMATDSINSFNVFGTRSTGLKDSMSVLIDSLEWYTGEIRKAVDPGLSLTDAQFADTLAARVACVINDATINTTDYLFEQGIGTGGSSYRVAGDLTCADDLRAALTAAKASYNYANLACTAGGGCPGWWKLACVGGCLIYNAAVYNQNKTDAFCDYMACMNYSCPFN